NIDFAASYQMQPRSSGRIPSGVNAGNQTMDRFVSYYANLAYTLKGKYTLTASSRWDASNIFGVAFNQKGVPLWSVGASWNVSDEKFADLDWLSYAKLRATFGLNGNAVRTISSLPVITYSTPLNSITRLPYGNLLSVGNPDLRWEQVQNLNFGMDFALFDRRISGSVEWYNKKGTDLLGDDLLDPTTGIHQVGSRYNLNNRRNYADLSTTGVDIELNTVNIRNVVQWQTTFLLNYARNTVTDYRTRQNAPIIDFLQGSTAPVVEGLPREQSYAIPWYGLDATGAPLVMVDGELGTDYNAYFNGLDRDKLLERGVSIPPYFGSVRNTISWRAFSASFNIVWKAGHRFRRESINYNALFGTTRMGHIDYLDRLQNPGDEMFTNVPSMPETSNLRRDQAYLFSEALVERGDLIRFQDVNFSYELP